MSKSERKAIGKSLRFEVFKRDSFRCQYCGAEAPAVVLHVDHIVAVANGGDNDVTNLITSCMPCNLGKSDVELSDHVAVSKARAQLDELQERREQLELMMQWRNGLRDIRSEAVDQVATYWSSVVVGSSVSDFGKTKLTKLLDKHSPAEICDAIDAAAATIVWEDGTPTRESCDAAFSKLGGICRVRLASRDDPDLSELYYMRGILRKRLGSKSYYFHPAKCLQFLKAARSWGVPMNELNELVRSANNWTSFKNGIVDGIAAQKAAAGSHHVAAGDAS